MLPKFYLNYYLTVLVFGLFCGCGKSHQSTDIAKVEPFRVTNLYPIERLPVYFNRVVVMPCFYEGKSSSLLSYADDIINLELSQARLFETVRFDPQDSKRLFGTERINSSSSLPDNFLGKLKEETDANGVLFVDIDNFNSYRPFSVSIRAKLVDLNSADFMWAVDETFDSGHASVIAASKFFQNQNHHVALSAHTGGGALQSPRLFLKFCSQSIFSTLPSR